MLAGLLRSFFGVGSPLTATSDDNGWYVRVALPGVAPEQIDVSVAGRALCVRAIEKDGDAPVTRYEHVVTVPESVDMEQIAAAYRHGLLELTLPYHEAVKPRRIAIATEERQQLPAAA